MPIELRYLNRRWLEAYPALFGITEKSPPFDNLTKDTGNTTVLFRFPAMGLSFIFCISHNRFAQIQHHVI